MINYNRKNIMFGTLVTLFVLLSIGAYDVLDRYKVLKAQDIQIIDKDGNLILSLADISNYLKADKIEPKDFSYDISSIFKSIDILESQISLLSSDVSKLNSTLDQVQSNQTLLSSDVSKLSISQMSNISLKSEISDLVNKYNQLINDFESYKSESYEDEDITQEIDTDIEPFDDWEAPAAPAQESKTAEFIPYDKPPKPKAGKGIFNFLEYPELAKEMKLEGKVFIKFFVDKKGNVKENSISMIRGNPVFEEAAISAVSKSKWWPAMQREKKVGVWMTVPLDFNLQ